MKNEFYRINKNKILMLPDIIKPNLKSQIKINRQISQSLSQLSKPKPKY